MELPDEIRSHTRLSAAECNSAVCSKKIQIVNPSIGIQFLRRIIAATASVAQRLRIQTIAATERTTMERHERSDAVAVSREAMPRYSDYLYPLLFHGSIISNIANLQQIICKSVIIGQENFAS